MDKIQEVLKVLKEAGLGEKEIKVVKLEEKEEKRLPFLKFEIRVDEFGIEASSEESEVYEDFDKEYKFGKDIKDIINLISSELTNLTDLIVERVNEVDNAKKESVTNKI